METYFIALIIVMVVFHNWTIKLIKNESAALDTKLSNLSTQIRNLEDTVSGEKARNDSFLDD